MTISINGSEGFSLSGQFNSASTFGFKNRIINGNMMIDQRNNGSSVTLTNGSDAFDVDRFKFYRNVGGTFTAQRSSTAPTGFVTSMVITASTGASPSAAQYNFFKQDIEGYNVADLNWGTANAQPVTLSFWVRSSITGTYGLGIANNSLDRGYVATYTINSANTWEYKTVTIAGDTTGTWEGLSTAAGIRIYWDLGAGTDSNGTAGVWGSTWKTRTSSCVTWGATTGATFYITGVQLEKGSTATSFDYRPYGTELQLCQRYYQKFISVNGAYCTFGTGHVDSATAGFGTIVLPVTTRAAATFGSSGSIAFYSGNSFYPITSFGTVYYTLNTQGVNFTCSGGGMTAGRGGQIIANNSTTAYVDFNAEL